MVRLILMFALDLAFTTCFFGQLWDYNGYLRRELLLFKTWGGWWDGVFSFLMCAFLLPPWGALLTNCLNMISSRPFTNLISHLPLCWYHHHHQFEGNTNSASNDLDWHKYVFIQGAVKVVKQSSLDQQHSVCCATPTGILTLQVLIVPCQCRP